MYRRSNTINAHRVESHSSRAQRGRKNLKSSHRCPELDAHSRSRSDFACYAKCQDRVSHDHIAQEQLLESAVVDIDHLGHCGALGHYSVVVYYCQRQYVELVLCNDGLNIARWE